MRFRGRLAGSSGDRAVAEERLKGSAGLFRELEVPFWIAVAELELAERLVGWGRESEAAPLLDQAGHVFERLQAKPWLERLGNADTALPMTTI